jgi:hypothetical protein
LKVAHSLSGEAPDIPHTFFYMHESYRRQDGGGGGAQDGQRGQQVRRKGSCPS